MRFIRTFCSALDKPLYVTTPIFYVNASPHIGHLYSAVISDAICRYVDLKHANNHSLLTTGTDEHGTKIQQAAANHNIPVAEYCTRISQSYRNLFDLANVKYSDFIRTTESRHTRAVQHFWKQLKANDRIYSTKYSGWYCVSDETFLTESQLKENANGVKVSAESGHAVEWTEEENYMFKLSMLQEDVMYWIKQGNRIKPSKFEKILLDYLNEPLPDVSISRPSSRVHWGIKVPDDDTQTIYVWLDALVNYLTSVGYPDDKFTKSWPASLHVIGKDILKFHGIYWSAFLIAAGLAPPQKLLVHSHWTVDGQKMSKSKFNVVDPVERSQLYTMEGLRYFLLREGVQHSDGNYSETKILRVLNSELADTLGNLLSRACAKSLNPRQLFPGLHITEFNELLNKDYTKRLIELLNELPDKSAQHYDSYNFHLVVDQVMAVLHAANNFFESSKPWELKKNSTQQQTSVTVATTDDTNNDANVKQEQHQHQHQQEQQNIENCRKLETIIMITMETLRVCAIILQPIIPGFSEKLLDKLNVDPGERYWLHTKQLLWKQNGQTGKRDDGVDLPLLTSSTEKSLGNNVAVLFRRIVLDTKTTSPGKTTKKVKKISGT